MLWQHREKGTTAFRNFNNFIKIFYQSDISSFSRNESQCDMATTPKTRHKSKLKFVS